MPWVTLVENSDKGQLPDAHMPSVECRERHAWCAVMVQGARAVAICRQQRHV